MRIGSLFTGTGGLDLAVASVLDAHPVWFTDNDPAAARLLAHHWPTMPNHGDVTAIDWRQIEPVDVLTAGWPCQPFSSAGKRKGAADDRALWPQVERALHVLRPAGLVLENVPRILTAGEFTRVADSLARCGYRFGWLVLGADETGAPHRRGRCFIVGAADTDSAGRGLRAQQHSEPLPLGRGARRRHPHRRAGATSGLAPLLPTPRSSDRFGASAHGDGGPDLRTAVAGLLPTPQARDGDRAGRTLSESTAAKRYAAGRRNLDDGIALLPTPAASRSGRNQSPSPGAAIRPSLDAIDTMLLAPCATDGQVDAGWGWYTPAINRWEAVLGRAAPDPTVTGARGGKVLNPALTEWLMGLPAGWITSVPGLSRTQQLALAGNGVVPTQAEVALRCLLLLLGTGRTEVTAA